MSDSSPASAASQGRRVSTQKPAAPDGAGAEERRIVTYRGRLRDRRYEVKVRHGIFRTRVPRLMIDGFVYHPEEETADHVSLVRPACVVSGLRCREVQLWEPSGGDSRMRTATITARSIGFFGAGEADLTGPGFATPQPLIPEDGSLSAIREERRVAQPRRFAMAAALRESARYLLPLLGLGVLLAGVLDPVEKKVEEAARPPVEWIGSLLRPISDAVASLLGALSWLLDPIGRFLGGLLDALVGWVPAWVVDIAFPVLMVVLVFWGTLGTVRRRGRLLEKARKENLGAEGESEPAESD